MNLAKTKFRVGVFMGGRSIEHEVSFNSARTICDHIDSSIYEAIPIYQSRNQDLFILPWSFLHRGKTTDFEGRLEKEAKKIVWDDLKQLVDFVYLAVHGRYAEDGTLQGMLEVLQIPYLGSGVFTSSLTMDKEKQGIILKLHGIDVPAEFSINPAQIKQLLNLSQKEINDFLKNKCESSKINFPCIVKPAGEGSSLGISVVFDQTTFWDAILHAATCDSSRIQTVLVEEKLVGMEFVCMHIEKDINNSVDPKNSCKKSSKKKEWLALPITEIVPEETAHFFDYKQKYMPGMAKKITPARCSDADTKRIQDICLKVTDISGFSTLSRIDGFLTKDGRIVILDSNTITGMGPATFLFHQAAEIGMSHTDLINHLIKVSLQEYGFSKDFFVSGNLDSQNLNDGKNLMEIKSKIRVAVLLGGNSNEREISLESGRNICYKLSPHKYEVIPLFLNDKMELFKMSQALLVKNSTKIISESVSIEDKVKWADLPGMVDFVFIGLHGGAGENGSVQGTLEMLNLPYNGSGVFASSLCMDKYRTNNFLRENGFDVPVSFLVDKASWLKINGDLEKVEFLKNQFNSQSTVRLIVNSDTSTQGLNTVRPERNERLAREVERVRTDSKYTLDFPVILKPHDDGCSVYVQKIKSFESLVEGLDNYFLSTEKEIAMIEECITATELTCGVLGNENPLALIPSQPIIGKDILSIEEKFLPGAGENQTPANIPQDAMDKVRDVVAKAYKAIGCSGYARIDCFYQSKSQSKEGQDKVILLEFNTLPGVTPATCIFHQAAELGMRPMDFVDKIIEFGFETHKREVLDNKKVVQAPLDKNPSDLRSN